MVANWKTVRVFISSTFRDMHAERDHLVTVVFPELRERVERLGLEFYDVDLRWGVPQTGVDGERANSWEYCKRWIDRVEPFFVCMLGQRYGWTPPAREIADEHNRVQYAGMSITEMEIRHAVLSTAHRKRSFFYLRKTAVPEDTLAKIYEEFVDCAYQSRLSALKEEISKNSGRSVRHYDCHWTGNGFDELEAFGQMVLEDLWSGVLRDPRYVPKQAWWQVLGHDPDQDSIYTDESQIIPQPVWEKIVEQAKPAPRDPLDVETEQMDAFAATRLRWFQGREKELRELAEFVGGLPVDASRLCVVRAVAGQGKSALLAKFCRALSELPQKDEEATKISESFTALRDQSMFLIPHFVGATERSADVRSLLERLVQELDRNGIPHPSEEDPKQDLESLKKRLAMRFENYAGDRRVVIVIDAINKLTSGHDLSWLPHQVGTQVRIIVSCIDDPSSPADRAEARAMSALRLRRPQPQWISLTPLEEDDVHQIVVNYLAEYCKELDREQIDAICRMEQAKNPLYLLVMLHELRTLGGQDMNLKVPGIIADLPRTCPNTVRLFDWMLERLEVFGAEAVRLWCTYLALGRIGMSSRELFDLLARKMGTGAARTALLIERGIRRYLQRRGAQWDFFHGQMREAVIRRYLPQDPTVYHADIAAYLETRWREPDHHALSELPYHETQAQMWSELVTTLTTYEFVEEKVDAGMTFDLVRDYNAAEHGVPASCLRTKEMAMLKDWRNFISILCYRLWRHLEPFLQIAYNYAQVGAVATAANNHALRHGEPWLRLINRTPQVDSPPCVKILEGHTLSVEAVAMAPEKEWIVSGSADATLRIWDFDSGECLQSLSGHTSGIKAVAVTSDGKWVVSGSEDQTVRVWDPITGECVRVLRGHTCEIRTIAVVPGKRQVVSGSEDKTLRLWDIDSGQCHLTFSGHNSAVNAVVVLPDGKQMVSGSSDDTLRVWDLQSGKCLHIFVSHSELIETLAVTPDGRLVVSGNAYGGIRVWDLNIARCVKAFKGHLGVVSGIAVLPDGSYIVSASWDGTLGIWSIQDDNFVKKLEGHGGLVNAVIVTPDGSCAISAANDRTLRVWDLHSGQCEKETSRHANCVNGLVVTPDARLAVSASDDKTLLVWDMGSGRCKKDLIGHDSYVCALAVTPDGEAAVSGDYEGVLRVWDLRSAECRRVLTGHTRGVRTVTVTPDGRRAVSGGPGKRIDRGEVKIWDLKDGSCLHSIEGISSQVTTVIVAPDGERLIWGDVSGNISVWNLRTGDFVWVLQGHRGAIGGIGIAPDSIELVSSGREDGVLKLWDFERGLPLGILGCHAYSYSSVLAAWITPDGQRAVSASNDNTLRIWNLTQRSEVACFSTQAGIWACAVSPEGTRFVAGDRVGRVYFLALENVLSGPPILTVWHSPTEVNHTPWYSVAQGRYAFGCPLCRMWSEIPESALGTELPCPNCGKAIKLNPFTINADWRPIARAWQGTNKEYK